MINNEQSNPKIFLSWSGDKSKKLAELFKPVICEYLRLDDSEVFISSKSIAIGADWWKEISSALNSVNFGIVFVTSENCKSPWLNYETGLLQNKLNGNIQMLPVSTSLDFPKIDKTCPLCKFQFVNNIDELSGSLKLLKDIASKLHIDENYNNQKLNDLKSWDSFHNFIIPSSPKQYINFKEMLKFWVPKVRAEWKSPNKEKGYFINEIRPSSDLLPEQLINYQQVEKEDNNFNSEFLNLLDEDNNTIGIKFYGENGQLNWLYDSCLTWIPKTKENSWFLKLVYDPKSDSLKVAYVFSKVFNKGDSQEFKEYMKNFNMISVEVSKLELDKPGVNNEVKALYNNFLGMINYSKK